MAGGVGYIPERQMDAYAHYQELKNGANDNMAISLRLSAGMDALAPISMGGVRGQARVVRAAV